MFGFAPKLPVTDEDRCWVDEGFRRLEKLLGRQRLLEAVQVLPEVEHFPDPYNKSPEAAELLFCRVSGYMNVDRSRVEFEVFSEAGDELRGLLPYWRTQTDGCAGLYKHEAPPQTDSAGKSQAAAGMVVAIRRAQLDDPLMLVATIAHELGHVILIGGGLLDSNTPDHEPLTDLLTIYLGFGIFTANAAGRFKQFQDGRRQGWSMHRLGYLPEEVFGYALARFAHERSEAKPAWVKHLSTNIRAYYKRSSTWLAKNAGHAFFTAKPIG